MCTESLSGTHRKIARLLAASLIALALLLAGTAAPLAAQSGGTIVTDNFNRADGALGANWAKPIAAQNNLVVVGNQVGVDVEDTHNYAFWAANTFGDNQYSQDTITKIGAWTGVILRADSSLDRFYFAFVFGPNDYRIYNRWDGAYNALALGTAETWQVGDTLRLEVKGSANPVTITMYRNGHSVLSWTSVNSGQVRTGGSPGIGIFSPAGEHLTLDNFEGGDLIPDTQPPTAPANVTAAAISGSQINLSWSASTDNVGVTGYLVERQGPGGSGFAQIGTAAGTAYSDSGLAASTSYSYRIRATDAAGNLSGYSTVVSTTTLAPDNQPPTAPGNLTATASSGQISLNWTASTDNVSVTGYFVERQGPGGSGFAQVGTTAATTYIDTGLQVNTSYSYRMRATDAAGNLSPYSPVASATTPAGSAVTDNFNRADGALGANWAKPSASQNNLVVNNNQVGVDVEGSDNYAFWTANTFGNDQYSQITVTKMGSWPGVILRADSVLDRFYLGLLVGPNDYRIYSRWDGTYNQLAGGAADTWQVGDTLRLEIKGSANPVTITMYHNGAPVLTWTSATSGQVRTGGSPGIGIFSPPGQNLTLDNWAGGDLVP